MLDSTAAVAAERQGKNARQLLEAVVLETGDEVVVLDPLYQQLYAVAEALGCRLKRLPLRFDEGLVFFGENFR